MPKDPHVEASFLCQECKCNPEKAMLAFKKEFSSDRCKENDVHHSRKCNFKYNDSICEQRKIEVHPSSISEKVICNKDARSKDNSAGFCNRDEGLKEVESCLHSSSKLHNQVVFEANTASDKSESASTLRKQRRLILNDEEDEVVEEARCHNAASDEPVKVQQFSTDQTILQEEASKDPSQITFSEVYCEPLRLPARPFIDHIWRGNLEIGNEQYGPVAAHLSTRACARVYDSVKLLTPVLHMEKLPRLMAWPNSFRTKPPTDDSLALYFFPIDPWSEAMIDQLLDDLMGRDLMLKITFDIAELLVYSSLLLPEHCRKFDGKYFLWGVFKRRQVSLLSIPSCSPDMDGSARGRPQADGCHYSHDSEENRKQSSPCTSNSASSRESTFPGVPATSLRNQCIMKETDRLKHPKEDTNRKLHCRGPHRNDKKNTTGKWFQKKNGLDIRHAL